MSESLGGRRTLLFWYATGKGAILRAMPEIFVVELTAAIAAVNQDASEQQLVAALAAVRLGHACSTLGWGLVTQAESTR